jgi:hypothetical protein
VRVGGGASSATAVPSPAHIPLADAVSPLAPYAHRPLTGTAHMRSPSGTVCWPA